MGWKWKSSRRQYRFGPLRINTTRDHPFQLFPRFTSIGAKWWRWSRNFTRGTETVDTPGPGKITRNYRR